MVFMLFFLRNLELLTVNLEGFVEGTYKVADEKRKKKNQIYAVFYFFFPLFIFLIYLFQVEKMRTFSAALFFWLTGPAVFS